MTKNDHECISNDRYLPWIEYKSENGYCPKQERPAGFYEKKPLGSGELPCNIPKYLSAAEGAAHTDEENTRYTGLEEKL